MSENDPLRAVLQEWKAPEPSAALDDGVRAGFRAMQPPSACARFWSMRVSVPLPALAAAALMLLVAAAWLVAFRPSRSVAPARLPGVVTRLEATGFQAVPDGPALVREIKQ